MRWNREKLKKPVVIGNQNQGSWLELSVFNHWVMPQGNHQPSQFSIYLYNTRSTHAYDASRRFKRQVQVGCAAQVSGISRLVGVQRAVPNNGNVKSEPKYLAVKILQYVLSTVELFLVLFLLSWLLYGGLTSWFSLRVTSHSALASALDSAKYVCCKGPATLSPPSSVAKKCRPDIIV